MRMAIEAPAHLQRMCPAHQRHLVHATMAAFATDALGNMDAVIEICEIRQIVNSSPLQGFAGSKTFSNRSQHGAVVPDQRMTTHADFRRRNPCERRRFDGGMAKAAIDAQAADMMFVAEWNRLLADDVRFAHV